MAVRLIAGRAGSGKTHHCLSEICTELRRSRTEGPRLLLIVPEQAGLQMERALLSMLAPPALGRCEVISFRRLAHRILNESTGPALAALSANGRVMALRYLIGQSRQQFQEFARVADRPGFLKSAARAIVELIQEAVTPEQLEAAADAARSDGDPSAPRLADTALLYRAYLEYLGSERVDPEGVLDLARARLVHLKWPDGARIWIDGFAGLTRQQVRMVAALARRAAQVDLALLMYPGRTALGAGTADPVSLFARTERTWDVLSRELAESGVALEEPLLLTPRQAPRFAGASQLLRLESNLFAPRKSEGAAGVVGGGEPVQVHFIQAPDRRAEVESAVAALVDLVHAADRPMRYRDIAIVMRDLTPYHDLVSAALAARGVPFFIDRRRPTIHHPIVQLVRGLLSMPDGGAFDSSVAVVLKSGLSGIEDADAEALENYVLAHGMVRAGLWRDPWKYPPNPARPELAKTPAAADVLRRVNAARTDLMAKLGSWAPEGDDTAVGPQGHASQSVGGGRRTCRGWIDSLVAVMERMGVRRALARWCDDAAARGELDEAREHEQVWADLTRMLTEAAETLGADALSGWQFREVLEAGLAEFTVGLVPATVDQVLVSSIERSRHPPVKAVFVLGFGEGAFPSRTAEDPILSDEFRLRLEAGGVKLGPSRVLRLLDERMLAYIAFTRPSEFLWVSFPQADEAGKPLAPSPYWQDLRAALPEAAEEDCAAWFRRQTGCASAAADVSSVEQLASGIASGMRTLAEGSRNPDDEAVTWEALYEWARRRPALSAAVGAALRGLADVPEAKLTPGATRGLWPPPNRTSVTALEQFARCPFRHFAGYGLRLEPRPRHEVSSIDLGRMYHTILEQYVNELTETGRTLREVDAKELAADLSRLCREVMPRYAEEMRMDPGRQRGLIWRGEKELPAASLGQKRSLSATTLAPAVTEVPFGDGSEESLPALRLPLSKDRFVELRGKIDRVDLLRAGDATLGVVFDYKRSFGKILRLEEVYHGLALQLMAYLLVLRDHGARLAGDPVTPGAAFYLPLLSGPSPVDHPSEADDAAFNPLAGYRPRGIVDVDWIPHLDRDLETGRSAALAAYLTTEGAPGHLDTTDVAPKEMLAALMDHVRGRMAELADRWLSGDISVSPILLGTYSPCTDCLYRGVCRVERIDMFKRRVLRMRRTEVFAELGWKKDAP